MSKQLVILPFAILLGIAVFTLRATCQPRLVCAREAAVVQQHTLIFQTPLNRLPKQIDFTTIEAANELAMSGPTVLFFKANWCGTCTDAQFDLNTHITSLPGSTTIVTVDYDKERALKTKYGITAQHSWVIIDALGNALDTWVGGATSELQTHISALL